MAKIVSEKQVNTFVKGLITEASPLTFPENASIDEENFVLELNGSRKRRLGVDYELGYQYNPTGISETLLPTAPVSSHNWYFPGGSTDIVLGIVRIYNKLFFVNLLAANPSANVMNGGLPIVIAGLSTSEVQTTTINNYFILTSSELSYPIRLSYNKVTDTVSQTTIPIRIRDLVGVDDLLFPDVRPIDLTQKHKYNLINQGWNSKISSICSTPATVEYYTDPSGDTGEREVNIPATTVGLIECTKTQLGVYPSNADIWSLGKVGDAASSNFEKYDPNKLKRNAIDNTLSPKGAIILNPFNRGNYRELISGCTGLDLDQEQGRITTVASYASRAFYSGVVSSVLDSDAYSPNYSGYIFFSQVTTSPEKLEMCYQSNDPTSADISDLLDTDGGTIQIPEANRIIRLIPTKQSLVIFAENGIWELYGDTGGFTATSFQVSKISSIGISNSNSVVDANGTILYWAKTGIYVITQEPTTGRLVTQNISLSSIQSFYNDLPDTSKLNARGFFDETKNTVCWLYNDSDTYTDTNYVNTYTKQLNLSLSLQAFYKFNFSELVVTELNKPRICGFFQIPGYSLTGLDLNVVSGNDSVLSGTDPVVVSTKVSTSRTSTYNYLTFKGGSFTNSKQSNTTFVDWSTENSVGIDYSSYLITGYEYAGDILREKQVPYIQFYFTRTEDGFTLVGNDLIIDNPSSCLVQAQWNWTNSANSGKWGTQFQAYRFNRNYIPSGAGDTFDYGDSVIVTKNKLRGSGKVLSLKIQSETGKDMQLLGWGMMITGKSEI